jgi:PAS domain S-box-containing protein
VAVGKFTLTNIAKEMQTALNDNSIICLVDPRGIVFFSSEPAMIFDSLWPVAAKDLADLKDQYDRDHYAAIFPDKIGNDTTVDYKRSHYLVSSAETIHAGWSVIVFRPYEPVGTNRLTGMGVPALLAILALALLGGIFHLKTSRMTATGRSQAMFDGFPEAIALIDPETLQIMEADTSLGALLGYTQDELLNLKLDRLINQTQQEIHDQLEQILQEGDAVRMEWRARKKDGSLIDLEVIGSWMAEQGHDRIQIFFQEKETLPQPLAAASLEKETTAPPQAVQDNLAHAKGSLEAWNNKVKDIQAKLHRPQSLEDSPPK